MKSIALSLLALSASFLYSANASAQSLLDENGWPTDSMQTAHPSLKKMTKVLKRTNIDLNFSYGFRQNNTRPLSTGLTIGYEFVPRLYALFNAEWQWMNQVEPRTYSKNTNLGGGLGLRLTGKQGRYEGKRRLSLDLRAMAGASVSGESQNNFYDAALLLYGSGAHVSSSVIYGVGYRYTNMHSATLSDLNTIYLTVGIRF